jgi:hypothetical protein
VHDAKWQESCAEAGRDDPHTISLFEDMRQKRRAWTQTIEKAKTSHWRQFLDEAGEGKLWKSATYMRPRDSWGCIPALKFVNWNAFAFRGFIIRFGLHGARFAHALDG